MTVPQTVRRTAARCFADLLRGRWRLVTLFFTFSLLAAAFESGTMALLALALHTLTAGEEGGLGGEFGLVGRVVDDLAGGAEPQALFVGLVLAAVVVQLLRSGAVFGGDATTAHLVAGMEGEAQRRLFSQFMSVSFAEMQARKTGALASYVDQVGQLGAATIALSTILVQLLLLVAYATVLVWLSWPMSLVALAGGVLMTLSLRGITARIVGLAERYKNALVDLSARVVEYLSGLKLVRTYAREEHAMRGVGEAIGRSVAARRSVLVWQATISPLIDVATVLALAAVLLGGYFLVGRGRPEVIARLATFLFVLYRLVPRLSIVNKNWGKLMGRLPFVGRLGRMLRTDDKQYPRSGDRQFRRLERGVTFEGASIRYAGASRDAVRELSFELPKGSMLALVGESGAGKTTVANLLMRLYEPTAGRILVDGVDLGEIDWTSWRDRLGVVGQDTFIFHATVRENIAFGKLDADDEEIERAARVANAHRFIQELDDGYDTVVGDQGFRLSGGQRQRISIARAILRDPEILVLDEATSDLDSRAERLIQESIEALRSRRTVLAIAHRLSTVRMADEILVLEDGRLVERGSHDELVGHGGRYAELWRLQSGAA